MRRRRMAVAEMSEVACQCGRRIWHPRKRLWTFANGRQIPAYMAHCYECGDRLNANGTVTRMVPATEGPSADATLAALERVFGADFGETYERLQSTDAGEAGEPPTLDVLVRACHNILDDVMHYRWVAGQRMSSVTVDDIAGFMAEARAGIIKERKGGDADE